MPDLCFIGIDAGTTGVLVAAFGDDGGCVAQNYREYGCTYPAPGWIEQDMDVVWEAISSALRATTAVLNESGCDVRSVALSSQRGTFVLLDEAKRPLGPAIVWNDSRALVAEAALAERIDHDRYRAITGMPISSYWSVCKVMWLQQNKAAQYGAARWICNGQEYFLHRLGAERLETDPASQTLSGMLDIRRLGWSGDVCARAGIDSDLLPPMGSPGMQIGSISAAAAEATGLAAGTPLCRGAGDQQCAAIGAGVVRQGRAEITMGTSAMMVAHLEDLKLARPGLTYIGGHAIPGKWDLEGGAFSIGNCVRWWRDNFGGAEPEAGRPGDLYAAMIERAMAAPAGAKGLVFHPFFSGQVTPNMDTMVRGAFHGLDLSHDRACMFRAVLEGCACEIRMMVEAFDQSLAGGVDDLRVTGGLSRSDAFVQLLADMLDRPLKRPAIEECTVLGAAMLGAVGVGECRDIDDAVSRFVKVGPMIEPGIGRATYDDVFSVFTSLYRAAADNGSCRNLFEHRTRLHGSSQQ